MFTFFLPLIALIAAAPVSPEVATRTVIWMFFEWDVMTWPMSPAINWAPTSLKAWVGPWNNSKTWILGSTSTSGTGKLKALFVILVNSDFFRRRTTCDKYHTYWSHNDYFRSNFEYRSDTSLFFSYDAYVVSANVNGESTYECDECECKWTR